MLLAGIISHSEETAGLIRRFLGEMTRSRGLSLSCVSYDNSYAFLGDWRRGVLGYTEGEALSVLSKLDPALPVEELIKKSLIGLAKF